MQPPIASRLVSLPACRRARAGVCGRNRQTVCGLRSFEYDGQNRLSKVQLTQSPEAAKITYLHNALGQRVFKSEPQVAQTAPSATTLGTPFVNWLQTNFGWMFAAAQVNATLGQSYVYDDGQLGSNPVLLGEYGNGGAQSPGRSEYIWLPNSDGTTIPIALYNTNRLYAVHADHLNTPRLVTADTNKAVWQLPYSAFGDNKPTGVLSLIGGFRLKATAPAVTFNLRFPGQYFDEESNLAYNYFRSYQPTQGRYAQSDPIGLDGGMNRFAYVIGNPLSSIDPLGLLVEVCKRSVDISWIPGGGSKYFPSHSWLKTDSAEAGMGANCPVPGQGCSDRPLDRTYTKNHSGQSSQAGASCTPVPDVDEQCVNKSIALGQYLGRWTPANQCQSYVQSVIDRCTTNGANRPYIGFPRP